MTIDPKQLEMFQDEKYCIVRGAVHPSVCSLAANYFSLLDHYHKNAASVGGKL